MVSQVTGAELVVIKRKAIISAHAAFRAKKVAETSANQALIAAEKSLACAKGSCLATAEATASATESAANAA